MIHSLIIHTRGGQLLNRKAVAKAFGEMVRVDSSYLLQWRNIRKRTLKQNSFEHVLFTMLVQPLRDAGWDEIRNMEDKGFKQDGKH